MGIVCRLTTNERQEVADAINLMISVDHTVEAILDRLDALRRDGACDGNDLGVIKQRIRVAIEALTMARSHVETVDTEWLMRHVITPEGKSA